MIATFPLIDAMLESRLPAASRAWLHDAVREIASGVPVGRLAARLAMASRHVPGAALAPDRRECAEAERMLPGWTPERWTMLETARVQLVLAWPDPEADDFPDVVEECFRYADAGESCALYRSLAHLSGAERFSWRAGEGCRTNMRTVFEAVACDTPYPFLHFDDDAWRQLLLKAVFIEAPLWRVHGLDARLSAELARMALDFADERRSAGRPVPPELWLCLGDHGGARGRAALELEMAAEDGRARQGAVLGLARAGAIDLLRSALDGERDGAVRATIERALRGRSEQSAFASLEGSR